MPSKLYEGRVSFVDCESGETLHASFLVAMAAGHTTYTIASPDGGRPVIVSSESAAESRLVERLVDAMRRLTPSAGG